MLYLYKFILSAFADEISPKLDEQIDNLKVNSISHIEVRNIEERCIIDYTNHEIKEIKRKLDYNGIKVSAIGSPIGKIPINEPFEKYLDRFKKTIEATHVLETPNIRMFSFFIPDGRNPYDYREQVISRLGKFIDIAKRENVILYHENEKSIYGDTAERCLDLLTAFSCNYLKCTFDPANFVQCDVEPFPHAFNLLKDHIAYIHIKDALFGSRNVVPAGKGDGNIEAIIKSLMPLEFKGFLSIEPHLNKSMPGGGSELFGVAADALKQILEKLDADYE